jgi:hypothetical protein
MHLKTFHGRTQEQMTIVVQTTLLNTKRITNYGPDEEICLQGYNTV